MLLFIVFIQNKVLHLHSMNEQLYIPSPNRYELMGYRRCGRSGVLLPEISLGFWHNFGEHHDEHQHHSYKALQQHGFILLSYYYLCKHPGEQMGLLCVYSPFNT